MIYKESQQIGYKDNKKLAIELLKKTIILLEEFNIKYFLISGTLLGYIRHKDFIPWDTDIDLMVDNEIINLLPKIIQNKNFIFIKKINNDRLVKICLNNKINTSLNSQIFTNNSGFCATIDLFTYKIEGEFINFFNKDWKINDFFPLQKVNFLNIECNIPKNPDHFLESNFGKDYMTNFKKY